MCVCTYAYLHQQILILLCITGFRGVGGLEKPEERKWLPLLWWYVHSPCFSHEHWPKPTVDSAAACDDGEGRNGNYKSAYPILPFVKFLGQQKCFNGPNPLHLPKASALGNPNIFPAVQLRSGSGPDWTTLQFHKDLYMCFTASPWAAFAGHPRPPMGTCISVCKTVSHDMQSIAPRATLKQHY